MDRGVHVDSGTGVVFPPIAGYIFRKHRPAFGFGLNRMLNKPQGATGSRINRWFRILLSSEAKCAAGPKNVGTEGKVEDGTFLPLLYEIYIYT